MLKRIEGDLWDWVEYNTRMLENSGLGFAPRTPVARMMEEGGAGSGSYQSRVPFIKNAPAHVRAIDQVLRCLPDRQLQLVHQYYIDRTLEKKTSVYKRIDRLHHEIQGALWMLR
jgi:hypothetical protein